MSEIDELFGEGGGAPEPRSGLALSLLGGGVLLSLLGLACTSAPGGILVLLGWMVTEKEMDRVESGYLPADAAGKVKDLRLWAYAAVLLVIGIFVAQALLFCAGFYDALWSSALQSLTESVADPAAAPAPPSAPVPAAPPAPVVPPVDLPDAP